MIPLDFVMFAIFFTLLTAVVVLRMVRRGLPTWSWTALIVGLSGFLAVAYYGTRLADKAGDEARVVIASESHRLHETMPDAKGASVPASGPTRQLVVDLNARDWKATLQRSRATVLLAFGLIGIMTIALLFSAEMWHLSSENTEQRFLNDALRKERVRFENLVDSIDGIVWERGTSDFEFTFVSRQSLKLLGYPAEQWLADPSLWKRVLHADDFSVEQQRRELAALGKPYELEYRMIRKDGRLVWIRESGSILAGDHGEAPVLRGVFQDITARKQSREEMERLNRDLLEASRHAGMAEVATSVLHNVGNLLNSISVSATLASDRMKGSKAANLRQAALLIQGHNGHLAEFLTRDPKGRLIPEYFDVVTEELTQEHREIDGELTTLTQNIEHIKEIVAMQQSFASLSGMFEFLQPADLLDDALRMNAAALERHRIRFVREYNPDVPRVNVDRHKVLQILINIIRNAKHALEAGNPDQKQLVLRVESTSDGSMVAIRIRDNGVGIAPDHLAKIFRHGFTTKKDGHGFGLHSASNFAREMGGQLTVHSDGPGQGAEFILTLAVEPATKPLTPALV